MFVVFAAIACHFPVELTPRFKTNAASAVYFAVLLLFPPPQAVALVGLAVLVGNATLGLRRNLEGRPMRGIFDTIFNASQIMTATGVGAIGLHALNPIPGRPFPVEFLAVPLAAVSMYLVNTGSVALVVGFHTRRSTLDVWRSTQRIDWASEAALYLIGLLTAVVARDQPIAALAMVIPAAVVYLATKRAVILNEQTVRAVEAMADMVDMRDSYTAEHSKRVAANVAVIAPAMGLSAGDVAMVRLAARVHDIGKIALPDSVLHKEGKLAPDEFAVMQEHPRHGYDLLSRFPQYGKGREIVLAHHERIDGKGYPRGIQGDRVPLGAQIIAVADALDAMTSDRPYRAALPLHQAMTELRLGRDTQWSSAVVDTLDRLLNADKRGLEFGTAASGLQTA
jgi:HD-GYP domain-containing protein (c-di-GMP phosphodiesterase class II)